MKKHLAAVIAGAALLATVSVGCGPKGASRETLARMREAQAECERLKQEETQLENRKQSLMQQKADLTAEIQRLEERLRELQAERGL
ncbi:MAG: hypothetical protein APR63_08495 [Desulfuromonas sp. SDB]|jgi:peptidoglycan hydrolase CwlO-like protein|nr:MAG: hypothetical protein APR63_08495 [Desulfuromonas sp. SDB]